MSNNTIYFKGGSNMPGRDGTGPMGQGAFTGRGMGLCNPSGSNGYPLYGRGCGLGLGRGLRRWSVPANYAVDAQNLKAQRDYFAARLAEVEKQLSEDK